MSNNDSPSPYFWTDYQQAQERLEGSVLLYEGQPVYVRNVRENEDGIPRADVSPCTDTKNPSQKRLDSPKFNRFRVLPEIGWVNGDTVPTVFLERRTQRCRTHGLCDSNVTVFENYAGNEYDIVSSRDRSFRNIWPTPEFTDSVLDVFPSLEEILINIKEKSIIAYSRKCAVLRDSLGLRWLYRNRTRIGLFTGTDTLMLFSSTSYHREEIMEDPKFTMSHIKEF